MLINFDGELKKNPILIALLKFSMIDIGKKKHEPKIFLNLIQFFIYFIINFNFY